MNLRILKRARLELEDALRYYRQVGGDLLGLQLLDSVDHAIQLLSNHPQIGTPKEIERYATYHLPLRRFPLTVVYQLRQDDLVIVAITHQRRRPGYWKQAT